MTKTSKNELVRAGTGYRVLDVRCVCVDDDAGNDGQPSRSATASGSTTIIPPARQPIISARRRFTPQGRSQPLRFSEATSIQIAAARRKRSSRVKRIIREERVPLLCALTGIAMSMLLAMLFSMFEPHHAALGAHKGGTLAEDTWGDEQTYGVQRASDEGRETTTPAVPSAVVAAILATRHWIMPLPAFAGLTILATSLFRRIRRAARATRLSDRPLGPNRTSQCGEPFVSPTTKQVEPLRSEPPSVAPEQQSWRRAA